MSLSDVISKKVTVVDGEALIADIVDQMVNEKVSSVLVKDADNKIIGIVTERDIVSKFTLLDVDDKLERKVQTIMSRPVDFVHTNSLLEDAKRLHLEKHYRHFPVIKSGSAPVEENVVGMASITDFFRYLIGAGNSVAQEKEEQPKEKKSVGILVSNVGYLEQYRGYFDRDLFDIEEIGDFHEFVKNHGADTVPLIFDMDGYREKELKNLVPIVKNYRAKLIMTTSNPSLALLFKKYVKHERQSLVLKPIDHRYFQWFVQSHFEGEE